MCYVRFLDTRTHIHTHKHTSSTGRAGAIGWRGIAHVAHTVAHVNGRGTHRTLCVCRATRGCGTVVFRHGWLLLVGQWHTIQPVTVEKKGPAGRKDGWKIGEYTQPWHRSVLTTSVSPSFLSPYLSTHTHAHTHTHTNTPAHTFPHTLPCRETVCVCVCICLWLHTHTHTYTHTHTHTHTHTSFHHTHTKPEEIYIHYYYDMYSDSVNTCELTVEEHDMYIYSRAYITYV